MKNLGLFFALFVHCIGSSKASPYDEAIDKILPKGSLRTVAIVAVRSIGPGASEASWEAGRQRVQSGLEGVISARKDDLKLIERGNLADIEKENALSGKVTRIQAVDVQITADLMVIEGKIAADVTATDVKSQAKLTHSIGLNPAELGIDLEVGLPKADALIRTLNARSFDITRNLVKQAILDEAFPPGSEDETAKIAENRRSVIQRELKEWAEESTEEISELAKSDSKIAMQAFDARRKYLIVEGRLRQVDTTRQIALLDQLRLVFEDYLKSGIEPNATILIQSCRKVADSEGEKTK